MANSKDFHSLMSFLDYLREKGLMKGATVLSRKASVNKVLSILDDEELVDVTALDLEDVISRFANKEGQNYNPTTLRTYKSRVVAAINDFEAYLEDPLSFRPQSSSRASRSSEKKTSDEKKGTKIRKRIRKPVANTSANVPIASTANTSILPIPLRENLTIKIQGIPYDLTKAEAAKLAAVINAMAMVD